MKPDAGLAPDDRQRGFWCLFGTQFQGAFSDNALKWLAIFIITGMGLSAGERDKLIGIVGALFALPFIAFSMAGGFLADRFSKRSVTIGVKVFEIIVMFLALAGLATQHLYLTISCVFLMGVHSAFFGPSKYGLLPELLPERKLSWGNGILELGTFISIIGGTVAGGWLCKTFAAQPAWSGVVLVALAFFGLFTSLGITKVAAADPAKKFRVNLFADLWRQIQLIRQDRVLWLATVGIALGEMVIVLVLRAHYTLDVVTGALAAFLAADVAARLSPAVDAWLR